LTGDLFDVIGKAVVTVLAVQTHLRCGVLLDDLGQLRVR